MHCTIHIAKTKQARGNPLKLYTLPFLLQMLPKYSPASCYLYYLHRRSRKWELEAMNFVQQQFHCCSFIVNTYALHGIKILGTTINICQLTVRKWQCSARPVGTGRSGRGSCGRLFFLKFIKIILMIFFILNLQYYYRK